MNTKTNYNTKQHNLLMEFLRNNRDKTFSVKEITDSICTTHNIGKSTVYRLVAKLVDDGVLQRMNGDDGKSVVYRYTSEDSHCGSHFHLKCRQCGKFVHLECNIFNNVQQHIKTQHGFSIDSKKTVIYGTCSNCEQKGTVTHEKTDCFDNCDNCNTDGVHGVRF